MNRLLKSSQVSCLSFFLAIFAGLWLAPHASARSHSPTPKPDSELNKFQIAVKNSPNLLTSSAPLVTQTVSARSLELVSFTGNVTIKGRPVKIGDRLLAGSDEISTANGATARLLIDNNIGSVELAENTTLKINSLEGGNDPVTSFFVSRGRVRLSIARHATLPADTPRADTSTVASLIPVNDLAQQNNSARRSRVRVETPEGVAGVRGTSFGVSVGPNGKTSSDSIDGSVGVAGSQQEVILNKNYWSTILPGQQPTAAKLNPTLAALRVRSLSRLGSRTFRFSGQVDPMDLVYINGEAIITDAEGKFRVEGTMPTSRRLTVVVRGPSVRERVYEIPVP